MRLRPEQIQSQLEQELAPVYLVSGDEPFQLEQVSGAIRKGAQAQGHSDREIMYVDRSFDWQQLSATADALSLFAEKRLLELRLPTGKPGDAGGKALVRYCDNPPADTVLLIVAGKLEKAQQNTRWFKALEQTGVVVQVWPVEPKQLPGWIKQRMQLRDMQYLEVVDSEKQWAVYGSKSSADKHPQGWQSLRVSRSQYLDPGTDTA